VEASEKDGAIIEVDVSWHSWILRAGQHIWCWPTISLIKNARRPRLLKSEERYRELFENANDIIYTIDLAGISLH